MGMQLIKGYLERKGPLSPHSLMVKEAGPKSNVISRISRQRVDWGSHRAQFPSTLQSKSTHSSKGEEGPLGVVGLVVISAG